MDGLGGLLFAAEKIGALVTAGGSVVDLGYMLSQSVELCGEKETLEALRAAGQRNPRIEAYRLAVETERRPETGSGERDRIKTLSYEQLKRELSAVKLYRRREFGEAADRFKFVRDQIPGGDYLSEMYLARCEAFQLSPPPGNWDGSFTLAEK